MWTIEQHIFIKFCNFFITYAMHFYYITNHTFFTKGHSYLIANTRFFKYKKTPLQESFERYQLFFLSIKNLKCS